VVSTYSWKKGFQNLWRPIVAKLLSSGVTPNQVTFGTLVLSVGFAVALSQASASISVYWSVPVFLFIRMALNAIDGMMAREGAMESPLGVFLNEMGDVVADVALFFALCPSGVVRLEPMIVFANLAVLSEMAGVVAVQVGATRRYEGPMGKSDRAVLIALISILLALGIKNVLIYDVLLGIGSAALIITIFNRTRSALSAAKPKSGKAHNS
jgi:CDP-diacylglycerol--glycerol-3-phosphate 3-phosphatidyltransferase